MARATDRETKPNRSRDALNANQLAFVRRFVATSPRNATAAYLEVYKCGPKAAPACASKLLKLAKVRDAIDKMEADLARPLGLTAKRIRREIAALSFSSVDHYMVGDDGRLTLAPGAPPDAMRAVRSVKYKRRTIPQPPGPDGNPVPPIVEVEAEFRLWDKPAAVRIGAQHRGMLVQRIGDPDGNPLAPIVPDSIEIVLVASKDGRRAGG